jgi:hypothetical protein
LIKEKEINAISSYEDASEMVRDISPGIYVMIVDTEKGRYYKKLVQTAR